LYYFLKKEEDEDVDLDLEETAAAAAAAAAAAVAATAGIPGTINSTDLCKKITPIKPNGKVCYYFLIPSLL
jgi:hypothetical protein